MSASPTRFILGSLAVTVLAAAGLFLLASSPHPIRPGEEFHLLLLLHEPNAALVWLALLLLAFLPALRRAGLRLIGWVADHPVGTSLLFLVAGAACALAVYRDHPLSMDEYAPRYQSFIFAAGRLTTQLPTDLLDWLIPPPLQGAFLATDRETGRVASNYWPGHALLMAPFSALGMPWLLNPLLGALTVWLVHRTALRMLGDRWQAGLATALTVASPVIFITSISYYSMPGHLALNLVFTLLVLRATPSRMMAAGAVGSLAVVYHQPLPHLLYAVPWMFWLAARRESRRTLPYLFAGYVPLSLLLGIGWFALLAELRAPPPLVPAAGESAGGDLAALWESWIEPVFSWPTWSLVLARLLGLIKLWLWAVPGLPLLAILALRRRAANPAVSVLMWSAAVTVLGYLVIPFDQGLGWGYRYFHAAWATLPLLAAGYLRAHRSSGREAGVGRVAPSDLRGYVGALALGSLLVGVSLRLVQVGQFIGDQLALVPRSSTGSPHVVLLYRKSGYHVFDLVQHDPFLRDRPLLMESQGEARDRAMLRSHFPTLERLVATQRGEVWGEPGPLP